MINARLPAFAISVLGMALLAACDENGEFLLAQPESTDSAEVTTDPAAAMETVERDVEAPEVFETTESGLWDGRPSLGGVWVAYPDVTDPERVLIRNTTTGSEVIGALFRRERENPGPRIQVSSDAASELDMLAGQPAELSVVALRREEVPVAPAADAANPVAESITPGEISEETLDPIAVAAAAIDEAEAAPAATAAAEPASAPAPAPASTLDRPFVQIGIFSVEGNANNAAASLRNIGIVPTIRRETSGDKTYWRVIVGPATSTQERSRLRTQVRELGFTDAYFVAS